MSVNTTPSHINAEDLDNTPADIDGFINVTPKQYRNFNLSRFSNVSRDIKNQIGNFIRNIITVQSETLTEGQKKIHLDKYSGQKLEGFFEQQAIGGSLRLRKKPKPYYPTLTGGGKKSRKNRRKTKKRRKSKRKRRKGKKSVKSRRK